MTARTPIDEIVETLGLSKIEAAVLLGISRRMLDAWNADGIPPNRQATIEHLYDLTLVLRRELKTSRIPEIVRTPEAWLGGRTMLDVLQSDGTDPIYAYLTRLFVNVGSV